MLLRCHKFLLSALFLGSANTAAEQPPALTVTVYEFHVIACYIYKICIPAGDFSADNSLV